MNDDSARSLTRQQKITVVTLLFGYAGYYACRSNLSIAMPMIARELEAGGMAPDTVQIRLGTLASVGVLVYAIGKFINGSIADRVGGRKAFLSGMVGSILFTCLFALGSFPFFTLTWAANRLVQSAGWVGIVKITSRWIPYTLYGTVMGWISLSYLFGDAAARAFLGQLLAWGLGWRGMFFAAACLLGVLAVIAFALLRESPADVGEVEPASAPDTVLLPTDDLQGGHTWTVLRSLLGSSTFWWVCLLSLGFTLMRETFNTWSPTYFTQAVGLSAANAARSSALFPLLGGVSVLIAGIASDRLGTRGRSVIILSGILLTSVALFLLSRLDAGAWPVMAIFMVGAIGFLMIGPYSYLGGAMALDLGGKTGSATACGIIDGIGYLGGVLAGDTMARWTIRFGWSGAYLILAAVALACAVPALLLLLGRNRSTTRS